MKIFIGNKGYHHKVDLSLQLQKRLESEGHTVTNPGPRGTYASPWAAQRSDAIVMHPGWDMPSTSLLPPADSRLESIYGVSVYRLVDEGYQKLEMDVVSETVGYLTYDDAWIKVHGDKPQPPALRCIPEGKCGERSDGQTMFL